MRIEPKVGVVVVADSREAKTTTPPAVKSPEKSNLESVVKLSAAGTSASRPADPEEIDPQNRTRLDEIRVAIKHDRYPIDLDKLASKMLDDEFVRNSNVS
jgi:anti-sigma28 factor (negative regulator of flagellin synthesis)